MTLRMISSRLYRWMDNSFDGFLRVPTDVFGFSAQNAPNKPCMRAHAFFNGTNIVTICKPLKVRETPPFAVTDKEQ